MSKEACITKPSNTKETTLNKNEERIVNTLFLILSPIQENMTEKENGANQGETPATQMGNDVGNSKVSTSSLSKEEVQQALSAFFGSQKRFKATFQNKRAEMERLQEKGLQQLFDMQKLFLTENSKQFLQSLKAPLNRNLLNGVLSQMYLLQLTLGNNLQEQSKTIMIPDSEAANLLITFRELQKTNRILAGLEKNIGEKGE